MKSKIIGRLAGPFSLSGEIRVQFLEQDLAHHLVKHKVPLYASVDERSLTPIACRVVAKGIAFKFAEITDRTQAEALSKGDLTASFEDLPQVTKDTYDLDDLIGIQLCSPDYKPIAIIHNAYNFGASDIVDCIRLEEDAPYPKEFTLPLTPNTVEDYDFDNHRIIMTDKMSAYIA